MYAFLCYALFTSDVQALGHDDWEAREGAQERLRRVLPFAGPWLDRELRMRSRGLVCDPEARRRAEDLISEWRAIGTRPKCMLRLLGLVYFESSYNEGEWFDWWDASPRKPQGEFSRKRLSDEVVIDPARRFLYMRYLYPLRVVRTDAQWWWDDTQVATRRLAADLFAWGIPKPLVRSLLFDE